MFLSTQQYEIEHMSMSVENAIASPAASERRAGPRVTVSLEAFGKD